ncbi:MAG: hypothetical protein GY851_21395, partial [bacterium]|nr:hypothetical protein [bacterium]
LARDGHDKNPIDVTELRAEALTVLERYEHRRKKYHLDRTATDTMQLPCWALAALIKHVERCPQRATAAQRWNLGPLAKEVGCVTAFDAVVHLKDGEVAVVSPPIRVPARLVLDLIETGLPEVCPVLPKEEEPVGWVPTHRKKERRIAATGFPMTDDVQIGGMSPGDVHAVGAGAKK